MTEFGNLDSNGNYHHIRSIPQQALMECPHFIMTPEHYRDDDSCRCDDPTHLEMREWGYQWNNGRWI